MDEPEVAQDGPYIESVEEGKTYWWCACGKSARQPFCDGSHKGTEFEPMEFVAPNSKNVFFCGCKRSKKSPLCDGAHNNL